MSEPTDPIRENAELRRRLDTVMHAGDMEHARMAALLGASQDMINQLAVLCYPDESRLWKLGGKALSDAFEESKRATAAVRPQADALLAELGAARRVVAQARRCLACLPSDPSMHERLVALSSAKHAYDEVVKARTR